MIGRAIPKDALGGRHGEDESKLNYAHVLPFGVFIGFLLILQVVDSLIGWDNKASAVVAAGRGSMDLSAAERGSAWSHRILLALLRISLELEMELLWGDLWGGGDWLLDFTYPSV